MAAVTPTVNRLQLGALIRYHREQAGYTQERLGKEVFPRASTKASQNKIALIEKGEGGIHHADLATMLDLLGVTAPDMRELIDRMHSNTSQRGRWGGYRAVYHEDFRKYIDLEEDADRIRGVGVGIVPDLLMCESYVRELFKNAGTTPEVMESGVESRMARTEILSAPDDRIFHFVLCESALRRTFGTKKDIVREQIAHLITLSRMENITIQVVPFIHSSKQGAFAMLYPFTSLRIPTQGISSSLEFVYLYTPADRRYLDDKAAVEVYDRLFTQATKAGLEDRDSRRFMTEVSREYR